MVQLKELCLPSSDGESMIHLLHWIPDGEVKAALQISHGMLEHIGRYDEFASFLASRGFTVFGSDHLGHGGTASSHNSLGYFAGKRGNVCVLKDLHRVTVLMERMYPQVPHFILGHSMGSFFVRRYLTIYGREVDGAIIMGTGNQALPLVVAGGLFAKFIGLIKGSRYKSRLMHQMVLGSYNYRFRPAETPHDWLSRDRQKVREYVEDPMCQFIFSCSAYVDFFKIMLDLKLCRQFDRIPRRLPIFLCSGKEDPVGDCGRGVLAVYSQFKQMGIEDLKYNLYKDCRHELLNEINRSQIYKDLALWMEARIP